MMMAKYGKSISAKKAKDRYLLNIGKQYCGKTRKIRMEEVTRISSSPRDLMVGDSLALLYFSWFSWWEAGQWPR